jgi:hypothetical protein
MEHHGLVTGLPGARSWPGARAEPSAAPAPPPGQQHEGWAGGWTPRRPSGARFRSRGRHADRRDGARRSPSEWPIGPHAAPPGTDEVPGRTEVPGATAGNLAGSLPGPGPRAVAIVPAPEIIPMVGRAGARGR